LGERSYFCPYHSQVSFCICGFNYSNTAVKVSLWVECEDSGYYCLSSSLIALSVSLPPSFKLDNNTFTLPIPSARFTSTKTLILMYSHGLQIYLQLSPDSYFFAYCIHFSAFSGSL